jgi:phage shock protein A
MGLFDRVSRVVRSNLNAAVSSAEDPEKILDQAIIDMQEDLVQMRQAVAGAIASQKRVQQQYERATTRPTPGSSGLNWPCKRAMKNWPNRPCCAKNPG